MKFSDNLKKLRKEKNMSQEELAEKLNVSRQSVSKWEMGSAYPEMDKILDLCKLFDVTIDELLNENIDAVKEEKETKNNVNKFIDDILSFITKTVDMFSCMKFKDIIKCIFELVILTLIFVIAGNIVGYILSEIYSGLFGFVESTLYYRSMSILKAIYYLLLLIVIFVLIIHIFKVRYLDYYEIVKEPKKEKSEKETEVINKNKERIIIRDENDSRYGFINMIVRFILLIVKFFAGCIFIGFCFSLIMFVGSFIVSFKLIHSITLFIGVLLMLISAIVINILFLIVLFNFIISHKNKLTKLFLIFIISLVIFGVGTGVFALGMSNIKVIGETIDEDSKYIVGDTYNYDMEDGLFIYSNNVKFVENEEEDVRIIVNHTKYSNIYVSEFEHRGFKEIYIYSDYNYTIKDNIDSFLDDLSNGYIVEPLIYDVTVYSNKENISVLKENYNNYIKRSYDEDDYDEE